MTARELLSIYNSINLNQILEHKNAKSTVIALQNIQDCPLIAKDNLIIYDMLNAFGCAAEETEAKLAKDFLSFDVIDYVRATEYVTQQQPELPAEFEQARIFSQLAEAWESANEEQSNLYAAIMTALQILVFTICNDAPALNSDTENAIREFCSGTSPVRENSEPVTTAQAPAGNHYSGPMTLESMKNMDMGSITGIDGDTMCDVYFRTLDNAQANLNAIHNLCEELIVKKNAVYDYRKAVSCLNYIANFLDAYQIIGLPVQVASDDNSYEACRYREAGFNAEKDKQYVEAVRNKLYAADADLQRKYALYQKSYNRKVDLSSKTANDAAMLAHLFQETKFTQIYNKINSLCKLAEKQDYPYAYALAADLNIAVLHNIYDIEKRGLQDNYDIEPFSKYKCENDIPSLLARYYYACFKNGATARENFECDVFFTFLDRCPENYNYLDMLLEGIITMGASEEDLPAIRYFIDLYNKYYPQNKSFKKNKQMVTTLAKLEERSGKDAPKKKGIFIFPLIWLAVSVLFPLFYAETQNIHIVPVLSIILMAALTVTQIIFMNLFPKAKSVMKVIPGISILLSCGIAYLLKCVLHPSALPWFANEDCLFVRIVAPAVVCGLPGFALGQSSAFRLQLFIQNTLRNKTGKLVGFVLCYLLAVVLSSAGMFGILTLAGFVVTAVFTTGRFFAKTFTDDVFLNRGKEFVFVVLITLILGLLPACFTNESSYYVLGLMGAMSAAAWVISSISSRSFSHK